MEGTTTYQSWLPAAAVLVSMASAPLILASRRRPNVREVWTLLAAVTKFTLVLVLLGQWHEGRGVATCSVLPVVPGVMLKLVADPLGLFFATVSSGLWIVTSCYSIGYMRGHHERRQTRYYASFALSLSATLGVAFSGNIVTFIIFYELLTLATYPLVVHKESREAVRAGRQYLAYSLSGGLLLIIAGAWLYHLTGRIEFVPGGIIGLESASPATLKVLFLLFLTGVGVKAGLMPLHSWLPAAMVAPTPVSALLHAVAVVKSGVFGVMRVTGFVFGPETMREAGLDVLTGVAAGATVVLASLIAFRQDNLKRRLAYSTVGHLSYIVMGAALLSPAGVGGGLFHLSTHAFMKITLFFCAGAIMVHQHKERVSELDGVGHMMPWTMTAFSIGAVGLIGLPPVGGFLSKWLLCLGSVQSGWLLALGMFLLSGLLNAGYFMPILHRAFFRPPSTDLAPGEASGWMVVPLCGTAGIALILGIYPDFLFKLFHIAYQVADSVVVPR